MVCSAKEPSFEVPECNFLSVITDTFHRWGDRMAVIDGPTGRGIKYSELDGLINTVAGNLYHVARVRKGDVICVCSPNCLEYCLLMLACPKIGAVVTGCNPAYTAYEIGKQMDDAGAAYFITTSANIEIIPKLLAQRPQLREVFIIGENSETGCISFSELLQPGPPAPEVYLNVKEDLAFLPYSSGTTGLPKGVMITHYNTTAAILTLGPNGTQAFRDGEETMVSVFPMFHVAGSISFYVGLMFGVTFIYYQTFDFETFLAANAKYKATQIGAPPPILVALAKHPAVAKYDLSSVGVIFVGAAPSSKETHEEVIQKLPSVQEVRQLYGMSENCGTFTSHRAGDVKLASVGTALPLTQYKIVDIETGEELPAGKDGEICMRGPTVMKGYLNNPTGTANTIKNGWLYTGDIGHYDESGHLYITDRLKELIKYKGFQVAPAELEALILTHPAVADVAVVGVPDLQAGELPRAFVTLKEGHKATEDEIRDFVKSRITSYKQLRGGVEFLNEIPKSASGKLLRRILQDKIKARNLKSNI